MFAGVLQASPSCENEFLKPESWDVTLGRLCCWLVKEGTVSQC